MWPLEFDRVAPSRALLTRTKRESKTGEARHDSSSHRASSCPSWARTRTLLIQSQACCQLHQGAKSWPQVPRRKPQVAPTGGVVSSREHLQPAACDLRLRLMELRGLEPLTSWVRSRRSPS